MSSMAETKTSVIDQAEFTPFLKRIMIVASGGVFLDGYLLVIIGIAFIQLGPQLNLDSYWTGIIGAAALVGILVGGPVFGYVTDLIGRRVMSIIDLMVIIICSVWCVFVTSPLELAGLRFLIGLAIGADYPIASSLCSEFTPIKYRGFMVGFVSITWYFGALASSFIGYYLLDFQNGWAWMLGSAAIPAIFLIIARWYIPESPRWLLKAGKKEKALEVVKRVYGEEAELSDLVGEEPKKTHWLTLFQASYFKRVLFCGLFWMFQVIPCFAIYTFGPQILTVLGMNEGNNWIWGYAIINLAFLMGCIPGLYWVESMGRRPMLIRSYILMAVGLAILSIQANPASWLVVLGFSIYAFFSGSPSVLCYVYPTELFPTEIRASAMGMATAISRIGAALGTFALPWFLATYGAQYTMIAATVITLLGLLVSVMWAVETKGKTLSEAAAVPDQKSC